MQAAKADAERTMEQARQEINALQQTIDELTGRRANAMAELGRLQQYLAGTLDPAAAAAATGTAPAAPAAPATSTPAPAPAMQAAPDELTPLSAAPDAPGRGKGAGKDNKEAVFTNANGDRPA